MQTRGLGHDLRSHTSGPLYILRKSHEPLRVEKETRPGHDEATDPSSDRLQALYVLAVTAGLRRGELLGLRWEDVDLESGTLQVRRTLSEPKGGYVFEAPKSGKGR